VITLVSLLFVLWSLLKFKIHNFYLYLYRLYFINVMSPESRMIRSTKGQLETVEMETENRNDWILAARCKWPPFLCGFFSYSNVNYLILNLYWFVIFLQYTSKPARTASRKEYMDNSHDNQHWSDDALPANQYLATLHTSGESNGTQRSITLGWYGMSRCTSNRDKVVFTTVNLFKVMPTSTAGLL